MVPWWRQRVGWHAWSGWLLRAFVAHLRRWGAARVIGWLTIEVRGSTTGPVRIALRGGDA